MSAVIIGQCHKCRRWLSENDRLHWRGQHIFCSCCAEHNTAPAGLKEVWQWFAHWFLS